MYKCRVQSSEEHGEDLDNLKFYINLDGSSLFQKDTHGCYPIGCCSCSDDNNDESDTSKIASTTHDNKDDNNKNKIKGDRVTSHESKQRKIE